MVIHLEKFETQLNIKHLYRGFDFEVTSQKRDSIHIFFTLMSCIDSLI